MSMLNCGLIDGTGSWKDGCIYGDCRDETILYITQASLCF